MPGISLEGIAKLLGDTGGVGHRLLPKLFGGDGYFSFVRSVAHSVAVEKETAAGVEGQARPSGGTHDLDRLDANDGYIEAHVLIGLGDFHDREAAAQSGGIALERAHQVARAFDGGVGAFHGFDRDAGGFGDDDGLADVVLCKVTGNGAAVSNVLLLLVARRTFAESTSLH